MSTMQYIRDTYRVPARRGQRVEYRDMDGTVKAGVVTQAHGARVRIRLDGERSGRIFHPTWNLRYL